MPELAFNWETVTIAVGLLVAALAWKTGRRKAAGGALLLSLGAVFLAPVFAQSGEALSTLRGISPLRIALVVAIFQTQFFLLGGVLRISAGVKTSIWKMGTAQYAAAFFSRFGPGGLGGWAYDVLFLKRQGVDSQAATAAVTAKVSTTALCNAIALALASSVAAAGGKVSIPLSGKQAAIVAGAAAVIFISCFTLRKQRHLAKVINAVCGTVKGVLETFRNPRKSLPMIGLGLTAVVMQTGTAVAALKVCGYDGSIIGVAPIVLLAAAGAAATPAPGGIGATEAAFLAAYAAYGIDPAVSISAVAVMRFANFWVTLLPGAAFAWLGREQKSFQE